MTNLLNQAVVPSPESYRFIPLTKGMFAVVDVADYEFLNQWKWYARGKKETTFYAARRDNKTRKTIDMHTVILPARRGKVIDHRSRFGLDNRRLNLRYATIRQNTRNRSLSSRNSSGQIGVASHYRVKRTKKWKAYINVEKGVQKHLGYFSGKDEA